MSWTIIRKIEELAGVIRVYGEEIEIADGGFTDWTQQLLEEKKERLLVSGMGFSLLYQLLQKANPLKGRGPICIFPIAMASPLQYARSHGSVKL